MPGMITLQDIQAAASRLQGQVLDTPCVESKTLSQIVGAQVFLKFENLQFTASFKERGACNKLTLLTPAECARGVVAMSAGNHAQGVAYHAQRLGLRAVIVMPRFTPGVKVERTRGFGAEVVLHGDTLEEARAHAYRLADSEGLVFVHPYDDEAVAAGQGTLGLEMLRAVPDLDTLVIAVGGGGLIAGVATAAKALRPDICFYANADAHRVSPRFGEVLIPVEWVEAKRTRERTRTTLVQTREAMEAGRCLAIFPAGKLARRMPDGTLADPEWMPSAVALARKYEAPLLPIHVAGPWSTLFHLFNDVSPELRDITLFHELLNKRGRPFRLTAGPLVAPQALDGDPAQVTARLKAYVERDLPADRHRAFA